MKLDFEKYHGTGNDFILADNRTLNWVPTVDQIKQLCDRHFGIGADGVILIEKSDEAQFYVNYFNSDGSKSFCGNGSRCAVQFAASLGIASEHVLFDAIDGLHHARMEDNLIAIKMRDTAKIEHQRPHHFAHTGSPHIVKYVEDVNDVEVVHEGRLIRFSEKWKKEGTNVNFVEKDEDRLMVRTYERGVEDETLSCGTGVTAVALTDFDIYGGALERTIDTPGGTLRVTFEKNEGGFTNIWLIGPAQRVFSGQINLEG
ncbi:MAG: hypothetical protein RL226_1564 [Bacteroidota bacterium]